MAKNYVNSGDVITITGPSGGLSSGDPYVLGQIPCVALGDIAENENGEAARRGVFNLSVRGVDGAGNSAVALGDQLYYVAADTPKLSKKNSGVPFGKALGTVAGGATSTIPVLLDE